MPPKTFKFKLQSILEYKKKVEEEEIRKLAELKVLQKREQEKLEFLKMTKVEEMRTLTEKSAQGVLNVSEIQMYHAHIKKLDKEITEQEIRLQQIAIEVEEQRQRLLEASKEKKIYEKLKEKHKATFLAAIEEEERKFIDELATMRYDGEAKAY